MANWVIKEEAANQLTFISYHNNPVIKRIWIANYITIFPYLTENLHVLNLDFADEGLGKSFLKSISSIIQRSISSFPGTSDFVLHLRTNDPDLVYACLTAVHKLASFNQTAKDKLSHLGFILPSDREELLAIADTESIESVLSKAQQFDDPDAYLILGQHYQSQGELQKAIECYESVIPQHVSYKTANRNIRDIIVSLLCASQHNQLENPLTVEEIKTYNDCLFDYMLNAPDETTQSAIDNLYSQMQGRKMGEVTITNIGRDTNTLIRLAKESKLQLERIKTLEKENFELKEKMHQLASLVPPTPRQYHPSFFSRK